MQPPLPTPVNIEAKIITPKSSEKLSLADIAPWRAKEESPK
ncbi:hypothetical protein [Gottfriedia sp. OAE603]